MGIVIAVWLLGVAMVCRRCERAGRAGWRVEVGVVDGGGARPYRVGRQPLWLSRAPQRVRATGAAALAMGTMLVPGLFACVMVPVAVGHAVDAAGPWARGLVGGLACLVWMQAALATPALALLLGDELLSRRGDVQKSAEQLGFGVRLASMSLAATALAVLALSRAPNRWALAGAHLGLAAAWLLLGALVRGTARDYGGLWNLGKRAGGGDVYPICDEQRAVFERVHILP